MSATTTARILRIELRRSAAVAAAAISLLVLTIYDGQTMPHFVVSCVRSSRS